MDHEERGPLMDHASQFDQTLAGVPGVVLRQRDQKGEVIAQALGIPWEQKNKYDVALLPEGKKVAERPDDPNRWQPTHEELLALDKVLFVAEESSCLMRTLLTVCGGLNLRPLTLHFMVDTSGEAYHIQRPCHCGALCCCPLEMNLFAGSSAAGEPRRIGRVVENFDPCLTKCCAACCTCTYYHDIQGAAEGGMGFSTHYTIRANVACCGRVNNCCGATCWKNDQVFDVLDPAGTVVAHIQKTYAPGGTCALCCSMSCYRCCAMYNNYVLQFPPHSTAEQRMLLVAALFQIDYQLFEKKGGDDG